MSTKKFKIKEKIQVSLRGKTPSTTLIKHLLDCHRKVTLIILKAAEDCCRNEDRQTEQTSKHRFTESKSCTG